MFKLLDNVRQASCDTNGSAVPSQNIRLPHQGTPEISRIRQSSTLGFNYQQPKYDAEADSDSGSSSNTQQFGYKFQPRSGGAGMSKILSASNIAISSNYDQTSKPNADSHQNIYGSSVGTFSKPKSTSQLKRMSLTATQRSSLSVNKLEFDANSCQESDFSEVENTQQHHRKSLPLGSIVPTPVTSDTDYSDLDQRVHHALNMPEIKFIRRFRSGIAAANASPSSDSSSPHGSPASRIARLSVTSMAASETPSNASSGFSSATVPRLAPSSPLMLKFNSILSALSSNELEVALDALQKLIVILKKKDEYGSCIEPKIDQLIILCNKQYRLYLTKHYPEAKQRDKATLDQAEKLFRSVSFLVRQVFICPLGKLVSRDTLRELITHLMPFLVEFDKESNISQSVNYLFSFLLDGADQTNLMSAFIRILYGYVGKSESERFMQFTMKFLWRLSRFIDKYFDQLNLDVLLLEAHVFFKAYPSKLQFINELNIQVF